MKPYRDKIRRDKLVFAMLVVSFMLSSLASEFFVKSWAGDRFEIYSSVTLGTLILFAALVRLKLSALALRRKTDAAA